MKGIRVGFGVLAVAIFISWFSFGTAYAQGPDYTKWEGRWLKVNTNFKGYERNLAGPPNWFTVNERFTMFLVFLSWNDPDVTPNTGDEYFSAAFEYYDEDLAGWQSVPVTLNYLHGSPLDFLIWVENDGVAAPDIDRLAFAARLSGKLNRVGDALQTVSFKCLGGYFIEKDTVDPLDPIYSASGVTMTGTLVPLNFCDSARNRQYPPCHPR
jgi:hypothetical protein